MTRALLLVATLAACALVEPVGPRGMAGHYVLRRYDQGGVPSPIFGDEQIRAGAITLRPDGRFEDSLVIVKAGKPVVFALAGTWTAAPDSIVFVAGGLRYTAHLEEGALVLVWPDLTARRHTFTYWR